MANHKYLPVLSSTGLLTYRPTKKGTYLFSYMLSIQLTIKTYLSSSVPNIPRSTHLSTYQLISLLSLQLIMKTEDKVHLPVLMPTDPPIHQPTYSTLCCVSS